MKKTSLLITLFAFLSFGLYANAKSTGKIKTISVILKKNAAGHSDTKALQNAYFWGYGEGPCLHLYRIDDDGFYEGGTFHQGFTITLMTANNYVGTVTICPPSGEWYV